MTERKDSEVSEHTHRMMGELIDGCPKCEWVRQQPTVATLAPIAEPRIVAECWTCITHHIGRFGGDVPSQRWRYAMNTSVAEAHRTAGHDVRPAGGKR